ncbi:MAG: glycerophosphodiester phosphodiesterase family protein [Pararobbsia sp.]
MVRGTLGVLALVSMSLAGCGLAGAESSAPALPSIVAHRGGTADYPENTLRAIDGALSNGADEIWLTVQLSADGVPVLYRPADLSTLTPSSGPVASKTAAELVRINAGWNFRVMLPGGSVVFPYRKVPTPIPTLAEALAAIPPRVPVILDMKALPAPPQAAAVAAVLDAQQAWPRVRIYSTDASYHEAFARYPYARQFETRDATRARLLDVALAQRCEAPPPKGTWAGFEWLRDLQVVETFTLGEAKTPVRAKLWTRAAMRCFNEKGPSQIVAFALNNVDDYHEAACLGVDAVLVDSPKAARAWRGQFATGLRCDAQGGTSR